MITLNIVKLGVNVLIVICKLDFYLIKNVLVDIVTKNMGQ